MAAINFTHTDNNSRELNDVKVKQENHRKEMMASIHSSEQITGESNFLKEELDFEKC